MKKIHSKLNKQTNKKPTEILVYICLNLQEENLTKAWVWVMYTKPHLGIKERISVHKV